MGISLPDYFEAGTASSILLDQLLPEGSVHMLSGGTHRESVAVFTSGASILIASEEGTDLRVTAIPAASVSAVRLTSGDELSAYLRDLNVQVGRALGSLTLEIEYVPSRGEAPETVSLGGADWASASSSFQQRGYVATETIRGILGLASWLVGHGAAADLSLQVP